MRCSALLCITVLVLCSLMVIGCVDYIQQVQPGAVTRTVVPTDTETALQAYREGERLTAGLALEAAAPADYMRALADYRAGERMASLKSPYAEALAAYRAGERIAGLPGPTQGLVTPDLEMAPPLPEAGAALSPQAIAPAPMTAAWQAYRAGERTAQTEFVIDDAWALYRRGEWSYTPMVSPVDAWAIYRAGERAVGDAAPPAELEPHTSGG